MPRKRRDEETILAFWKQFARDKDCPWSIRIYCTYALAVVTKMIPITMPPPGVARYKEQSAAAAEPQPPEEPKEDKMDVSDFLSRWKGGSDATNS
jgi:hypothetical protein